MKLRKKSIGIIFALALSCTTLAPVSAYAAETTAAAEQTTADETVVTLNKTKVSLERGKKITLKAKVSGAEDVLIKWKSSNKKVAVVDKKGVVTAKKKGNAVITARIKGTKISASCKVNVKKYITMKVKTTGYCNCSKCAGRWAGSPTAYGTKPKQGRTIAVDRSLIKLGTKVEIGNQMYVAEDVGGAIKGKKIDIYYSSHRMALSHGVKYQSIKVYI